MVRKSSVDVGAVLAKSNLNLEWLRDHYDELKQTHDNQWIIIDNQSIIYSSSSHDEIMEALRTENKNTAIIKYITSEEPAMVFEAALAAVSIKRGKPELSDKSWFAELERLKPTITDYDRLTGIQRAKEILFRPEYLTEEFMQELGLG